jgi:hypothetical protein
VKAFAFDFSAVACGLKDGFDEAMMFCWYANMEWRAKG